MTAGRHWATATSAPCTSVFRPVSVGPPPVREPAGADDRHDPAHLWWRHERVHRAWVRDPAAYDALAAERDALERRWVHAGTEPRAAWTEAEAWEQRAAAVPAPRDARPALVRGLWRRWDRRAKVWA